MGRGRALIQTAAKTAARLTMIPGRLLHRLSVALIPPATRERVLDAQLADFQHEYAEASSSTQLALAALRGYFAFWSALWLCVSGGLRKEAWKTLIRLSVAAGTFGLVFLLGGMSPQAIAMAPWILPSAFVAQKRVSFVRGLMLAVVGAVLLRTLGFGPQETVGHWLVGEVFYLILFLGNVAVMRRYAPK